jgi:hypothetical protein
MDLDPDPDSLEMLDPDPMQELKFVHQNMA